LVFLEANARGIPVIGSMDSGCKEAIAEGVSGYAVDAFDPMAIAERLQWILVDKRIAPEECKAWAQRHSIDQQVDSIAQVYREVTAPQG
jgi:phosphatidylinositol alpha-1,6-mannosyltransferase